MLQFELESLRKIESLLKKFLGDNVEGTLDLMEEEEVDEETFLNLDCSHLKDMGYLFDFFCIYLGRGGQWVVWILCPIRKSSPALLGTTRFLSISICS